MHRFCTIIGVSAVLAGLACSDGPTNPAIGPPVLTLPELIVSNALPASTAGVPSVGEMVAFVSLPPATLPHMVSARIRNVTAGLASSAIPIVDGGFDPVPVAAGPGDELELTFTAATGSVSVTHASVQARRNPSLVRTDLPSGPAPLNVTPLVVVFSEPIDAGTLAAGVRLMTGGTEVEADVSLLPDQPWTAELVPVDALEPGTTYELHVTTEVRDLDGDALAAALTPTFTTVSGSVTVQAVIRWDPVTFELNRHYSYRWFTDNGPSGDCSCPARRLTVTRISEPAAVVWEIVATTDDGFDGVIGGLVPPGAEATVGAEPVARSAESILYRVSVTLLDGRVGSAEFDSYDPTRAVPAAAAIAFVSDRDGAEHIYVANADGSGVTRVTQGSSPAWSWDGRKLAFVREGSNQGPAGIYTMDVDGSRLAYLGPGFSPAWSPDGRISFTGLGGWITGFIAVMDSDGSDVTRLFNANGSGSWDWPGRAAWSPDGRSIAFNEGSAVWIMDADGSDLRAVEALRGASAPAFSPDGSRIAAIRSPFLITYDMASGSLELVHTAPPFGVGSVPRSLDWTPDGNHMVFDASSLEGYAGGRRRIFTVSLETGVARQLIPDATDPVVADYDDWGAVWLRTIDDVDTHEEAHDAPDRTAHRTR